jgi:hypothetical protein
MISKLIVISPCFGRSCRAAHWSNSETEAALMKRPEKARWTTVYKYVHDQGRRRLGRLCLPILPMPNSR